MTSLLLDTHVFVWALADAKQVPDAAWPLLRDPAQPFFLSIASAWELAIKSACGKIALPGGVQAFVCDRALRTGG